MNSNGTQPGSRRGLSIVLALGVAFATISIAAAAGLIVALEGGRPTSAEVLREQSEQLFAALMERIRLRLDPVERQLGYFAELVASGQSDPGDEHAFGRQLRGLLATVPQVEALAFVAGDGRLLLVERRGSLSHASVFGPGAWADEPQWLRAAMQDSRPGWGRIIWDESRDEAYLHLRTSIDLPQETAGMLIAAVSVSELSARVASAPGIPESGAFIAYDRRHALAASSSRPTEFYGLPLSAFSERFPLHGRPLPDEEKRIAVLEALRSGQARTLTDGNLTFGDETRIAEVHGVNYVYAIRVLTGYSVPPLLVGHYFPEAELGRELRRIRRGVAFGLILLLLAIGVSWAAAAMITRPVRRLAIAADHIRENGIENTHTLPSSGLFELDSASTAFNQMTAGLRERLLVRDVLGKYVPKSVVDAILRDRGVLLPQTRIATIMFTDIAGFTALGEAVAPERLIEILNDYFSAVIQPIERYGGVIQQFQGDAILVTYNVPVEDTDHAANAVRTAVAIQQVLEERTFGLDDKGQLIRLVTRIGINSGRLVGGTVGAGGRLGYTVHGDCVNLAARIEELNKKYGTRVLIAQPTVDLAGPDFGFERVGETMIRGHRQSVILYRLPEVEESSEPRQEVERPPRAVVRPEAWH